MTTSIEEPDMSMQAVCRAVGLDFEGHGIVSSWPDFEDGRKARIFIQDPRLARGKHEGDIVDGKLYRQVLRETLAELAETFKGDPP